MIVNKFGGNGGGGGSYVLPTATATRLGGIKVGEGLSVDTGGTLSVSGGTQVEENYRIVSSLDEIQNPYEGLKAYVRSGSSVEQKAGYYFEASSITEDFVAKLWLGQVGQDERWKIYRSGTNFHWNWTNDGQIHRMENGERYCYYIADKANATFYIFPDNIEDYTVESFADASGETTTGVTITWPSASYMYDGSSWVYISDIVYVLDEMLQSERAALVTYMTSLSEEERIGAHIYKDKTKCRYRGIEGDGKIGFECEYMDFGYGYPTMKVYTFYVKPNGTFENTVNGTEYPLPLDAKVDYDNHTLTGDRTNLWGIGRCVEKGAPLTLVLWSGTTKLCTSKNAWVTYKNGYEGTIGGEFEFSGSTIKCEWSYLENTATLLYWDVETGLPIATSNSLGAVQVGEGLSVTTAGTLSSDFRQYIFVTDIDDTNHYLYPDGEWDCAPIFEHIDFRQDISVRLMSAWSVYSYAKSSWAEVNDSGECIVNAVFEINGSEIKASWEYDLTGGTYAFTNISWDVVQPSGGGKTQIIINNLTNSERADLYTELHAMPSLYDAFDKYEFFYEFLDGMNSDYHFIPLNSIADNNGLIFRGVETFVNGGAAGIVKNIITVRSSTSGGLSVDRDKYCEVLAVKVGSSSAVTFDNGIYNSYFERMINGNAPVSVRVEFPNITAVTTTAVIVKENGYPYLYAEFKDTSGNTYEGKWRLENNQTALYVRKKEPYLPISQSDYEALVAGGTVNPNTLYIIV